VGVGAGPVVSFAGKERRPADAATPLHVACDGTRERESERRQH
jgi:hypothetical protein